MAARPYWKGQIRLALVSIPVEIYSATRSHSSVEFRQIHEPSGKRVRYEKTVPGIGPVKPEDIVKGFEVGRDQYVLIADDEIEALKLESKRTLELTQFVDYDSIDAIFYDRPFYVVPADELAQEAYVVLRDALRKNRKVALGQLAIRGREYIVALKPCGRGILMETLRYADELNKPTSYFRDIEEKKPADELMELATALIERKSGAFDAADYHDRYADAVLDLVERKRKGSTVAVEDGKKEAPKQGNVIDLMAALRKSVEGKSRKASTPKAVSRRPAARSAGRKGKAA